MSSSFSDLADVKHAIRNRIIEMADRRRIDARSLQDSDVIPESGVLDSAGIMELIVWLEMTFDITIEQADLTLENFGTLEAIAHYLRRMKLISN
jgi:D-alanine--poly(phosphoribitol) ligase subunit 2